MERNISIKFSQDKRSCCDNRTTTCCIQNRSIQNQGSLFLEYDISSDLWKQWAGVWFSSKKPLMKQFKDTFQENGGMFVQTKLLSQIKR